MNDQERAMVGFEPQTRTIPLQSISALKSIKPEVKETQKYQQISASIKAVGLVELPVVCRDTRRKGAYFLLDGLLRLEVLKDLGVEQVECLISTDDESYTYNKQISRLSPVQEHRMVARSIAKGASEEKLASALNLDEATIRRRSRLLDGICPEVATLMADKVCPMVVFDMLRKMKPLRQIEAAELMIGQGNYSMSFARALLAATPDEQLMVSTRRSGDANVLREQIVHLERELAAVQRRTAAVEENYGVDNLQFTVAKAYLTKLLSRPKIVRWMTKNQPDFMAEFQNISGMTSLATEVAAAEASSSDTRGSPFSR